MKIYRIKMVLIDSCYLPELFEDVIDTAIKDEVMQTSVTRPNEQHQMILFKLH